MSARRSWSPLAFKADLRADRGQNAGAKIAALRAAELQALKDRNRAAAAAKAEGAVGYQLRPVAECAALFDVTLDGVVVAEAGMDRGTGEWFLCANDHLNVLPPRFTHWHSTFASPEAVMAFLGARVMGA